MTRKGSQVQVLYGPPFSTFLRVDPFARRFGVAMHDRVRRTLVSALVEPIWKGFACMGATSAFRQSAGYRPGFSRSGSARHV